MAEEHLRILRVINRFNLGGPTFNVAYLTRYLHAPFETRLVGGMKDESEASSEFILETLGIEGEVIPQMRRSIHPLRDVKAYRALRKIIRDYRPHIVHTHAAKAGTLGRLAAIHEQVPIVLHTFHGHVFHSYFGRTRTTVFKAIERYLASRCQGIVCISNQQKFEIGTEHRICPPEKIKVIPLGFDLDRFRENQEKKRKEFRDRYGLQAGDVAIGIVGRLVPVKNHRMFLRAAKALMTTGENRNYRFFIVGDGKMKDELMDWCRIHRIGYCQEEAPTPEAPLVFTSWIREVDLAYAGLDIVCLTSLNEGTPVSLIEAQSAGKPVVSTRVGSVQDIVEDGRSGWLCGVDEEVMFLEKLRSLADSASQRKTFGQAGRERVQERYHYTRLVADMRQYYLELLNRPAPE